MYVTQINKKRYKFPEKWEEITLIKFIEFFEVVNKAPEHLKVYYQEYLESKSELPSKDPEKKLDEVTFFSKCLEYWCGGEIDVQQFNVNDLYDVYFAFIERFVIASFLLPVEREFEPLSAFTYDGIDYTLGEKFMRDRALIEYVEGDTAKDNHRTLEQFYEDMNFEITGNAVFEGKWSSLPYIVALMCRPVKDQFYNEEKIKLRAVIFRELPMPIVWGVAFFLLKRLSKYEKDLQLSTSKGKQISAGHQKLSQATPGN